MRYLSSRKFIVCAAIVLGGIASVISGLCIDNNTLVILGSICGTVSGCLYAIVECICDTVDMETEGVIEAGEGTLEDSGDTGAEDEPVTTVYVNDNETDGSVG